MKKEINVSWMHCVACELLIENKLNEIDWVKVESVSFKKNSLNINIKDENKLNEVNKIIEELWYSTWNDNNKKQKKNNIFDYVIIFLIFVIFWALYFIFKDVELFQNIAKVENYSFFIIILIWVVASMSSCLAITWWIILWFSKYIDTSSWIKSHIKIQWMFHVWRILWFFIFGWILWSIWSYLWTFLWFNKALLLIAWVLMIYMWLNMANIVPSITKFWLKMPKFIWNKIMNIKNPVFTPIVWALTFFLPCWFTQSIQVVAASSWSFLSGALIMSAFALWTLPVLFLVWVWNSYFKDKNFDLVNKIIWVIVVYFWIIILSWFANLINFNSFSFWSDNNNQTQNEEIVWDVKKVSVSHNWYGLEPRKIVLEWAKNYELTIIPKANWLGCMFSMIIPWVDENSYLIKKWVPIVININNKKTWTYNVVCSSMWMEQWKIIIK